MSILTELHQIAVETAEALRKIQAQVKAEREASEDYMTASRESLLAAKEARTVCRKAQSAFQNEVERLDAVNVPNLAELYAQIGKVELV